MVSLLQWSDEEIYDAFCGVLLNQALYRQSMKHD